MNPLRAFAGARAWRGERGPFTRQNKKENLSDSPRANSRDAPFLGGRMAARMLITAAMMMLATSTVVGAAPVHAVDGAAATQRRRL